MNLSIIVPAYNEAKNLPVLLPNLIKLVQEQRWDAEIIIVDDNSTDETGKVIDDFAGKHPFLKALHRKKGNNGMGAALKEGTRFSKGKYILWTMADLSDKIETYPKIYDKLEEGYDMVYGSRYIPGGSRGNLDPFKAFCSSFYTKLCKLIFGIKVNDITNAFRGFRREVFDAITLVSDDYAISPEFSIKAHKHGFKLGEVPTHYTYRKDGLSKFKMGKMAMRYSKLFKLMFQK